MKHIKNSTFLNTYRKKRAYIIELTIFFITEACVFFVFFLVCVFLSTPHGKLPKENANYKVSLSLGEFSLSVRETWLVRKERRYRQKSLFSVLFSVFWQSSSCSTVIENISSQRSPQLAPAFANCQRLASALTWWLRAVHGRGDWKPWPC